MKRQELGNIPKLKGLFLLHLMIMMMALRMIIALTHHVEDPNLVSTFSHIHVALVILNNCIFCIVGHEKLACSILMHLYAFAPSTLAHL